ncbi:MAG: hypothetical protein MZV49_26845 [Rhodopseudomonas palustris]|nr:hypothetical protein [Rhodopseudomonas palustris]
MLINKVMNKKELANLIDHCYRSCGDKTTVLLADRLKDLGFKYATVSGVSFAISNMIIPENKKEIVAQADKDVLKIQKQYMDGLITDGERYNKVIDIWAQATEKIAVGNAERHQHRRSRTLPMVRNAKLKASTPFT